ncbi:MAG: hypothetical protein GEU79_06500 [Acidimicrobiia bacterium]|nr:hypothetical protein [Acidimicrobiia bacterium]
MIEMPALADLLDVQELDLQLDRLRHERQSLPELDRYKKVANDLSKVEKRLEKEGAELRQLELDTDKADGELTIVESHLEETEKRLFSGGMSARETENMRAQVDQIRTQKGTAEELVLGLLEKLDTSRDIVKTTEGEQATLNQEKESLESQIKGIWKRIDAEMERKQQRRDEAVAPVPADLVELYDKLRQSKEGVGIAALANGVCGGCRLSLSALERSEVAEMDPPRCVHCRRLLVV